MERCGDAPASIVWLRPDLAPRDRSLVTVAALIASGQVAQITFHLNRAMDNGLTREQAAEVITHLRRLAERNVSFAGGEGGVRQARRGRSEEAMNA